MNSTDDLVAEAEKAIVSVQNSSRPDKEQSEILKDISTIKKAYSQRKKELEKKKQNANISKEEYDELCSLEKDIPYNTYMRLLNNKEIENFYGDPIREQNIVLEETNLRPDKMYYWLLHFITGEWHLGKKVFGNKGYDNVIKTDDAAWFGETSQYGAQFAQTKGGKQQVAQAYLKTISDVMRSIFPLLYEIKQSDELLAVYDSANRLNEFSKDDFQKRQKERDPELESSFSAERTLRDKWASEVDGGKLFTIARPQSQQGPGYVLLPHWFFSTKVRVPNEKKNETWSHTISETVEEMIKAGSLNREVANVLGNYLIRFKIWQQESYRQLVHTRNFKVSFLRQQYAGIRLYIDWLTPMLNQIKRMGGKHGRHSKYKDSPEKDPNWYTVLDSTLLNVEFCAYHKGDKYARAMVVSLSHKSNSLTFNIGGQNQNVPFGSNDIKIKGYVWTHAQLEAYIQKRENNEFDILESMFDSMKDVREQVEKYLKQYIDTSYAEKIKKKHPVNEYKKIMKNSRRGFDVGDIFYPFKSLGDGVKSVVTPFTKLLTFYDFDKRESEVEEEFKHSREKSGFEGQIEGHVFLAYDIFKKAHKCLSW